MVFRQGKAIWGEAAESRELEADGGTGLKCG
jgi:hypothetical protein